MTCWKFNHLEFFLGVVLALLALDDWGDVGAGMDDGVGLDEDDDDDIISTSGGGLDDDDECIVWGGDECIVWGGDELTVWGGDDWTLIASSFCWCSLLKK